MYGHRPDKHIHKSAYLPLRAASGPALYAPGLDQKNGNYSLNEPASVSTDMLFTAITADRARRSIRPRLILFRLEQVLEICKRLLRGADGFGALAPGASDMIYITGMLVVMAVDT